VVSSTNGINIGFGQRIRNRNPLHRLLIQLCLMPGSATLVFVASAADVDHVAFAPSIIYPSIDDLVLALGARVARVVLPLVS
jgi:hypothetical protein